MTFLDMVKENHLSTDFAKKAIKAFDKAGEKGVVDLIRRSLIEDADIPHSPRAYSASSGVDISFLSSRSDHHSNPLSLMNAVKKFEECLKEAVEDNVGTGTFNHMAMADCLVNVYYERKGPPKTNKVGSLNKWFYRGGRAEDNASRVLSQYMGIDHLTASIPDGYGRGNGTFMSLRWEDFHEFRRIMATYGFSGVSTLAGQAFLHLKESRPKHSIVVADLPSPFMILDYLPKRLSA